MDATTLLVVGMVLLVALGVIVYYTKKSTKQAPDYYGLFWTGIIMFCIGISLENTVMSAVGLIFGVIGYANKDKWKSLHSRTWNELTEDEKKARIMIGILLAFLFMLGLIFFYMM